MTKHTPGDGTQEHAFGGDWTKEKLEVLAGYLRAYTTALQNQPFVLEYIDAFAGTGYLTPGVPDGGPLFPDLAEEAPQRWLDGSARLALKTSPPFDRYIFIERSSARCEELERLKAEFPFSAPSIEIHAEECNAKIQDLCRSDWRKRRAVLFLDPYGMQVEWATIERVAATHAIDMWLLFPLGIGVNRLAKKSGDIPVEWQARIDALLGKADWRDAFYQQVRSPTLFGGEETRVVKAGMEVIGKYFIRRLRTVFPGVAERPLVLRNSRNSPLYLLCFAAGNQKGAKVALRIANHLLSKGDL